jgi:hypothetical protein
LTATIALEPDFEIARFPGAKQGVRRVDCAGYERITELPRHETVAVGPTDCFSLHAEDQFRIG